MGNQARPTPVAVFGPNLARAIPPQFGVTELESLVRSDPEKVILHAFRTIEMFFRELAGLENVPIALVFDRVHEEKLISELLYQQLKTLKRLRNDVVHNEYQPRVGDGLIALGTLRNFYDDVSGNMQVEHQKEGRPNSNASFCAPLAPKMPTQPPPARYHWREFQEITRRFFEEQTSLRLAEEVELDTPSGTWRADLLSLDRSLVIECKSYIWTKGGNVPSAKIETARMACKHLAETNAARKLLVFQDDELNGKSLARYFVRLNSALLDGIEVWSYLNHSFERISSTAPQDALASSRV